MADSLKNMRNKNEGKKEKYSFSSVLDVTKTTRRPTWIHEPEMKRSHDDICGELLKPKHTESTLITAMKIKGRASGQKTHSLSFKTHLSQSSAASHLTQTFHRILSAHPLSSLSKCSRSTRWKGQLFFDRWWNRWDDSAAHTLSLSPWSRGFPARDKNGQQKREAEALNTIKSIFAYW